MSVPFGRGGVGYLSVKYPRLGLKPCDLHCLFKKEETTVVMFSLKYERGFSGFCLAGAENIIVLLEQC